MNADLSSLIWVRNRFPEKQSIYNLFIAVVFPVHIWAIIIVLQQVPTYILYLKASETIGTIAYTMAFILLECISITFVFILIGALLPQKLLKQQIVAQAALLVPLALCIAYFIHVLDSISFVMFQTYIPNRFWFGIWIVGFIPLLIVSYLIRKYQRLPELLMKYVDRVTIVSLIYIFGDLLAVLVIIWRNVFVSG